MSKQDNVYFCVFCFDYFEFDAIKEHYLIHFTKQEFCDQCDLKFHSNSQCNCGKLLMDGLGEDFSENSENWIDNFVLLQTNHMKIKKLPFAFNRVAKQPVKHFDCCPLCDLLKEHSQDGVYQKETVLKLKEEIKSKLFSRAPVFDEEPKDIEQDLRNHILRHFKYHRYKCKECPTKKYTFTFKEMFNHIKTEHGNVSTWIQAYAKTDSLLAPKLESFFRYYLKKFYNRIWTEDREILYVIENVPKIVKEQSDNSTAKRSRRNSSIGSDAGLQHMETNDAYDVAQATRSTSTPKPATKKSKLASNLAKQFKLYNVGLKVKMLSYYEITNNLLAPEKIHTLSSEKIENLKQKKQTKAFRKTEAQKFFCIFCKTAYQTAEEVVNCCRPIKCAYCGDVLVSELSLLEHMRQTHFKKQDSTMPVKFIDIEDSRFDPWLKIFLEEQKSNRLIEQCDPNGQLYECYVCDFYRSEEREDRPKEFSEEHMSKHLCYQPYRCKICQQCFTIPSLFEDHMALMHRHYSSIDEYLVVEKCQTLEHLISRSRKRFQKGGRSTKVKGLDLKTSDPVASNESIQKSQPTRFLSCLFCDSVWEGELDFTQIFVHYSVHLDLKPLSCNFTLKGDNPCGQKFYTPDEVRQHARQEHKVTIIPKTTRSVIYIWLTQFLYECHTDKFKEYFVNCPVCKSTGDKGKEKIQLQENELLKHIQEHLCYFKKKCIHCEESDIQFNYKNHQQATLHISLCHPELKPKSFDKLWSTYNIPLLDQLIVNAINPVFDPFT